MKSFYSPIIAIFLMISFSCADYSDLRLAYQAEKQFFKANKLLGNISINPGVASQADYNEALSKYQAIIDRFYGKRQESERIKTIVGQSWLNLAELYRLQQDFTSAQQTYDDLIRHNEDNQSLSAVAQFSKATMYERQGKLDTALVEYRTFFENYDSLLSSAETSNPNYLETPLKIARLHRVLNRNDFSAKYREARDYYYQLASDHPDSQMVSTIYHLLATTYADVQDWNNAIATLTSLNSEHPDTTREPFILFEIANIYNNQLNQDDRALRVYNKISDNYPAHHLNANAYLNVGNIYFRKQDYDNAREYYKKVIDEHEGNLNACARAQFGIGQTYEQQDEWAKAINEFEWIWTNYPLSREAMMVPNYIANHYQRNNKPTLAKKSFEEAVAKYQSFYEEYDKHDLAPVSLLQMAMAYANLEKWEDTVNTLEMILGDHPKSNIVPEVYLRLASVYEQKMDQKDRALQFYEVFMDRFENHPFANQVKQKIDELKQL